MSNTGDVFMWLPFICMYFVSQQESTVAIAFSRAGMKWFDFSDEGRQSLLKRGV